MKASKNRSAQERGKWFEAEIQKLLERFRDKRRSDFQRLYDTASAGSLMPKQKGDFIFLGGYRSWLLECKSSMKFESLSESRKALTDLIEPHQAASQRIWHRAGGSGMFLFYHCDDVIELWDGLYVAEQYVKPRMKLDKGMRTLTSLKTLEETLIGVFNL